MTSGKLGNMPSPMLLLLAFPSHKDNYFFCIIIPLPLNIAIIITIIIIISSILSGANSVIGKAIVIHAG